MLVEVKAAPLMTAFVAFLLRHIATIDRSAIFLIYDNRSEPEASTVAAALNSIVQPMMCLTTTDDGDRNVERPTIPPRSLILSLVDEQRFLEVAGHLMPFPRAKNNKYIYVLPEQAAPKRRHVKHANMLHVLVRADNRLDFLVWGFDVENQMDALPLRLDGEQKLVASFHWVAFRERVVRLPPEMPVSATIRFANALQMEVVQLNGGLFYTGTRIGLARIVAERMEAASFNIQSQSGYFMRSEQRRISSARLVAYVDRRQSVGYKQKVPNDYHKISIGHLTFGDHLPVSFDRYVVLAPRQLVPLKVCQWRALQKPLLLILLVAMSFLFLRIRLWCRLEPIVVDREHLLFETFARMLGITAGMALVRTRSERQLLVVIAIFAIWTGSIFSSVLYERNVVDDKLVQRFRTFDELCAAKVPINFGRNPLLDSVQPGARFVFLFVFIYLFEISQSLLLTYWLTSNLFRASNTDIIASSSTSPLTYKT